MFFSSADFVIRLRQCIALIKSQKPTILNITRGLGNELVTSCLLAMGATPIISQSADEMREVISLSDAININLESVDSSFIDMANVAAITAKQQDKCVVLDLTLSDVSSLRTRSATMFAESTDVICGSANEIVAIYNEACRKDIFLSDAEGNIAKENALILEAGRALSEHNGQVVAIKHSEDMIINELMTKKLTFGSKEMLVASGIEHAISTIISAFNALASVYKITNFELSMLGLAYFNLCTIQADEKCVANNTLSSPSAFKTAFIDALYSPNWALIEKVAEQKWC